MDVSLYRLFLRAVPYKKIMLLGGFVVGFMAMASFLFGIGVLNMRSTLSYHVESQIASLEEVTSRWFSTLGQLRALDESQTCSDAFLADLRQIAFLPDGIHELAYTSGNTIICSVTLNRTATAVDIGSPDFTIADAGMDVWLDRDMTFLNQPDLTGTFLRSGNFLVVVSPPDRLPAPERWIATRLAFNSPAARQDVAIDAGHSDFIMSLCDSNQTICVTAGASLWGFLADRMGRVLLGLAWSFILGYGAMLALRRWLEFAWGLPMRVRHLMGPSSVTAHYQPILTLATNQIDAIEVLARWRTVSGELIPPNHFLPIVEAEGLTRAFTEYLVVRVHEELSGLPERPTSLRVHFNIFPVDFDADWLLRVFAPLLDMRDRFVVVVELLESQQSPLEQTQCTIEILRENGILTYIDDFGAGYSNIEYLGHLPVAGVKLDRCFGQAPEGSLMAELLTSAASMIARAGYPLLVEGIENAEKLQSLRGSGLAEQAQGYHISRPLDFPALAAFMGREHSYRQEAAKPVLVMRGPSRLTAS